MIKIEGQTHGLPSLILSFVILNVLFDISVSESYLSAEG